MYDIFRIRYYLNQEPILNNIMTFQLSNPDQKNHVISEIDKMVIKKTDGSGGYGMLMGNKASDQEIESYLSEVNKNPKLVRRYNSFRTIQ